LGKLASSTSLITLGKPGWFRVLDIPEIVGRFHLAARKMTLFPTRREGP
jgi:hypothetical protein